MAKPPWDTSDATSPFAKSMRELTEKSRARGRRHDAYGDAVNLILAMEDHLSTRKRIPLKRFVLVPLWLIFRGLEQMMYSYGRRHRAWLQ